MGYQDVAFLMFLGRGSHNRLSGCSVPALPSLFSNTFLKNSGRGKCFMAATCPKTVVEVSKCMLPVKYFCSTKPLAIFVEFNGDHKSAYED